MNHHFGKLAGRGLLWAIPVTVVYLLLLKPVLLPLFTTLSDALLQKTFSRAHAQLVLNPALEWHVHTRILMPEQVPGKVRVLSSNIGKPIGGTLALPLLWTLLLAIPHQRLRNLLSGSLIMLVMLSALYWLGLCKDMTALLSTESSYQVFVSQTIQLSLQPVPGWLAEGLRQLYLLLIYPIILLLPIALAYALNRPYWHTPPAQHE